MEVPGLFVWENDLKKIMARLKENSITSWIGNLPSHTAQQICADIILAIKAMLSDMKKGAGSRDVGFPKRKKYYYAAGSVYLVNTQTIFDREENTVWLPKIKDAVVYRQDLIPEGKLCLARLYRQGEDWWMSCQFRIKAPAARPKTGRECGLKISTGISATVFDGQEVWQSPPNEKDLKLERRQKLAARRLSRRNRGTKDYYKTADEGAQLHAHKRDKNTDRLHKLSCLIAREYDSVTVHKTNNAELMRRKRFNKKTGKVERVPKKLVKANKDAASSQFR